MKLTTRKISYPSVINICKNCGNSFKGKICNHCGEKLFDEKTLTTKHFIHEAIDFFYHWESKVLKTIKLNFLKPGFVTKRNLEGIRVSYAKPVQLYLVVAFVFFVIVARLGVTDYIPGYGDQNYFSLSQYSAFKWASPIDSSVQNGIKKLWVNKGVEIENVLKESYDQYYDGNSYQIPGRLNEDSISLNNQKVEVFVYRQMAQVRHALFTAKVSTYGKILIFLLIPVFAVFFFLFFFKKLKYYGAALVLATHFMVYNLCFYVLWSALNVLPAKLGITTSKAWMMKPFDFIFYNQYTEAISNFVFGSSFEFLHLIFFIPWLYFCFRRMFGLAWWKNIIISFCLSRIFFFLIFGVLKKFIIAFTIWSIHY